MAHVEQAFETTRQRPDLITLLVSLRRESSPAMAGSRRASLLLESNRPGSGGFAVFLRARTRREDSVPRPGVALEQLRHGGPGLDVPPRHQSAVPSLCEPSTWSGPRWVDGRNCGCRAAVPRAGIGRFLPRGPVSSSRPPGRVTRPGRALERSWRPDRLLASWRHVLQEAIQKRSRSGCRLDSAETSRQ